MAEGRPQASGPSYSSASMRSTTILSTPLQPPPFGPSSLYAQTSQARNWRFSPTQLSAIRSSSNSAAHARLASLWKAESDTIPTFLSVSEELSLIAYYLVKIGQIVNALRLPELVEATAATYVKRFYLRNTVMDFHPKTIVITCIFLASKTENYPLNLGDFARKLAGKQAGDRAVVEENKKTVLGLEFLVSQSLTFEYAVTGAHRALYGLMLDLQGSKSGLGREEVSKLAEAARAKVGSSRLTDAEFVYTPSQIALACLRATGERGRELVGLWLDQKVDLARAASLEGKKKRQALREQEVVRAAKVKQALARRSKAKLGAKIVAEDTPTPLDPSTFEFDDDLLSTNPLGLSRPEVEAILDDIEAMITQREVGGYTGQGKGADDLERIKQIDARQKACMNPENTPGSRLYRKRQAEGQDGQAGAGKRVKREDGVDSDDDDVPQADGFSVKPEPQV